MLLVNSQDSPTFYLDDNSFGGYFNTNNLTSELESNTWGYVREWVYKTDATDDNPLGLVRNSLLSSPLKKGV